MTPRLPLTKQAVVEEIERYLRGELTEASGDAEKSRELESLLTMYRFLPKREMDAAEPVSPASLVEMKTGSAVTYCLIVPKGGGLVTRVGDYPVQVITPNSPLGEALLGRYRGDRVSVEIRGQMREYEILSVR